MSEMHMSWVRTACGRLKSDFRYSNSIVYNNFPWPIAPNEKQIKTIEEKAKSVLDVRSSFGGSSLADLYNVLTMPTALIKAHNELNKNVDSAYRPQTFANETKRLEFLFSLHEQYTSDLFSKSKKVKIKKSKPDLLL